MAGVATIRAVSEEWSMDVGEIEVRVSERPDRDAAAAIAAALTAAVARRGEAFLALSGGSTAPPMIAELVSHDLRWETIGVWQVDERVAPDGDRDRNAEQLAAIPGHLHLMPVTEPDLDEAASWYAAGLPERFDVVHLGLGGDGHTASWPPGDDAVVSTSDPVAVTGVFNGYRRMTLTPAVVNAAATRVLLTTGADKAGAVRRWLDGDPALPAHRLRREGTVAFVDRAASPDEPA